jgi:hypothetical protein
MNSSDQLVFICRIWGMTAAHMVRDLYVEDIFKLLTRNFSGQLIFAGVIDEKAKLLHFQKGKYPLALPVDRQNALDVQLSLVWTISKQLEDFAGLLVHTILTFSDSEVIVMQVSTKLMLYIICTRNSAAAILDTLAKLIKESNGKLAEEDDYVEHEWSGQ